MAARVYEFASNTPQLRGELMKIIADPGTTELLWPYAIRRLYRIGENHWERVSLLTDPVIQKAPRPEPDNYVGRLECATSLLIGEPLCSGPDWIPPTTAELSDFYSRLGEIFADATTDYMAEVTLRSLAEDATRRVCWGASGWGRILETVRTALDDPHHPVYRVPEDRRTSVNDSLERLFDRPNMLSEKAKAKDD